VLIIVDLLELYEYHLDLEVKMINSFFHSLFKGNSHSFSYSITAQVALFLVGLCTCYENSREIWLSSPSNCSLLVSFIKQQSSTLGTVIAYDIEYKSSYESQWKSISNIGSSGNRILVSQILSIRVDEDKALTSGSFQLALTRSGLIESDVLESTRTQMIPHDASSSDMLKYLSKLSNVKVKEVKRCDEYGLVNDNEIGLGGTDYWTYGCPYGSHGGYRWLILFDSELIGSYLPSLVVSKSYLGSTWSGPGNQIVVSSVHSGAISPDICQDNICSYRISSLSEGKAYTARYRMITDRYGILPFSDPSEFMLTLESKAPPRPQPPIFLSSTSHSVALSIMPPSPIYRITSIDVEYQRSFSLSAEEQLPSQTTRLLHVDYSDEVIRTLSIKELESNSSYRFRLRYGNEIGLSPWSSFSPPYLTDINEDNPSIPPFTTIPPITPPKNNSAPSAGQVGISDLGKLQAFILPDAVDDN
jgi:hypothetical protein